MIKLFTDTSANLPAELIKQYGISVVPFSYCLLYTSDAADDL